MSDDRDPRVTAAWWATTAACRPTGCGPWRARPEPTARRRRPR